MMFYKPNRTPWELWHFLPSFHPFLPIIRIVKVTQSIMFGQVIFGGTPFKVFNPGIGPVFVDMIDDGVIVRIGNKCFRNETMKEFIVGLPFICKLYHQISIIPKIGTYYPSCFRLSYPGQIANFVPSFKPFDGFPDFIHLANINMMPIKRK